jgi:serine/threonine protein kinase
MIGATPAMADEPIGEDSAKFQEGDDDDEEKGPTENLLSPQTKISKADFNFLKVIGRGSFGKVYMVKRRGTNNVYALKTLNKEVVAKRNLMIKTQGKLLPRFYYAQLSAKFLRKLTVLSLSSCIMLFRLRANFISLWIFATGASCSTT